MLRSGCRRMGIAILGTIVVVVGLAFFFRRSITDAMLFYPVRHQARTPAALDLPYEDVWLTAADGVRTQAWWIPGWMDAPVVLFFHGNAGTMSDRLENAEFLRAFGLTVLLLEYRGYGDSEGRPSEKGLQLDARAALQEARRRAGARPILLFGRSLGGAVAIELAAAEEVDGLVVESSFTSLPDMSGRVLKIPGARFLTAYDFDSIHKIGKIEAPLLVIHGANDELVPVEMGRQLYEAGAAARWRSLHLVEAADHNSTFAYGGPGYRQAWRTFLDVVVGGDGQDPAK